MEKDTRKSVVNTQDADAANVLIHLDPMNYSITEDFDLKIIDEDWISIMGVQIFVRGVIYSIATPLDIINGFNLIMAQKNSEVRIDKEKLLECISISEQEDRKSSAFELSALTEAKEIILNHALVGLLRLSYHYYKCSSLPGFQVKSNEVKTKIARSLTNVIIDSPGYRETMRILRRCIEDSASELLFANLALSIGRIVHFDSKHDLTIDDIPCEVKTVHDKYYITKDEKGQISFFTKKEDFGDISLLEELIAQVLRTKWNEHLKTAIEKQSGQIVFFNTYSTLLFDLNSMCNENTICCLSFDEVLQLATSVANSDELKIPLICSSCIVSLPFDQKFFFAKIPIIRTSDGKFVLDEGSINGTELMKSVIYSK